MLLLVFWFVTPWRLVGTNQHIGGHTAFFFRVENVSNMFLQNAGMYLQVCMALQPRRPTLTDIEV
jgi:hypothetical protein